MCSFGFRVHGRRFFCLFSKLQIMELNLFFLYGKIPEQTQAQGLELRAKSLGLRGCGLRVYDLDSGFGGPNCQSELEFRAWGLGF